LILTSSCIELILVDFNGFCRADADAALAAEAFILACHCLAAFHLENLRRTDGNAFAASGAKLLIYTYNIHILYLPCVIIKPAVKSIKLQCSFVDP
jgi:hypothetical protein